MSSVAETTETAETTLPVPTEANKAKALKAAAENNLGTLMYIDPLDIKVNFTQRHRQNPGTADRIHGKAISYLLQGQLQACSARKLKDGSIELLTGFGRWEAAMSLNGDETSKKMENWGKFAVPTLKDKSVPDGPLREKLALYRKKGGQRFKLAITVQENISDQEAIEKAVIENEHRDETSPIKKAQNMKVLLDAGFGRPEVAKYFGCKENWIVQALAMLKLPKSVQAAAHKAKISTATARAFKGLDEETANAILAEHLDEEEEEEADSTKKGGKAGKAAVAKSKKKANNKKITESLRKARASTGKSTHRGAADAKAWATDLTGVSEPKPIQEFGKAFGRFMAGTMNANKLTAKLMEVFYADSKEEEEK